MADMEKKIREQLAEEIRAFRLPRYDELPQVGLYLDQTVKYINACLAPLGCLSITGSMVRNYVKQGLVANPVHKHYGADQIGYLLCTAVLKQVMPLEDVQRFFARKEGLYDNRVAYDYFCTEMENVLQYRFGLKETLEEVGVTHSLEKEMLRSAITAVSHMIYLNQCFRRLYPVD